MPSKTHRTKKLFSSGTAHAFFWPGTPAYNQKARDDAWSRILTMLAI